MRGRLAGDMVPVPPRRTIDNLKTGQIPEDCTNLYTPQSRSNSADYQSDFHHSHNQRPLAIRTALQEWTILRYWSRLSAFH